MKLTDAQKAFIKDVLKPLLEEDDIKGVLDKCDLAYHYKDTYFKDMRDSSMWSAVSEILVFLDSLGVLGPYGSSIPTTATDVVRKLHNYFPDADCYDEEDAGEGAVNLLYDIKKLSDSEKKQLKDYLEYANIVYRSDTGDKIKLSCLADSEQDDDDEDYDLPF